MSQLNYQTPALDGRNRDSAIVNAVAVGRSEAEASPRDKKTQIVVVGGGATGLELDAELYNADAPQKHYVLEVEDYTRLDFTKL
ncbi:MAG: hypothetical protein AAFQ96_03570, partial [Pseudomonadota bacterium]